MNCKSPQGKLIAKLSDSTRKDGSIFIATNALTWLEVVDLGKPYKDVEIPYQVGDQVATLPNQGVEFVDGGQRYVILNQSDILSYKQK